MRRACLPPMLLCTCAGLRAGLLRVAPQHSLRTPPLCMLDELDLIPPPTAFPIELESPLSVAPRPVLTPDAKISASGLRSAYPASSSSPDLVATLIAPLTPIDCVAAALLAIAIYLGPDALFAPLGYAPDFRLGLDIECAVGRLGDPSADWIRDREEKLAADAPIAVRAAAYVVCAVSGLLTERLLLVVVEDVSFVAAAATGLCISAGLLEVIRPERPTRAEADARRVREADFGTFASARMQPRAGSSCHESEVSRAFRRSSGKYRSEDQISDAEISSLLRAWAKQERGRISERSPAGFYKGVALADEVDVGLGGPRQ